MRIQFVFLQQIAAGSRKIAEAEQEQLAGSGHSGMLAPLGTPGPMHVPIEPIHTVGHKKITYFLCNFVKN